MMEPKTTTDQSKTLGRGLHRAERAFARLDRLAAWVSALILFLYFLSGFGMTKPEFLSRATAGLISWRVAYDIHHTLIIPLMIAFTIHTFTGVRRALLRRTLKKKRTAWIAAGLGAAVLTYLLIVALAPTGL